MKTLILSTPEDITRFNDIYCGFSKRRASEELLLNGVVRVFLNENGEWIAGYCINSKGPLQYFACIDPQTLNERLNILNLKDTNFVETIAMWIKRDRINLLTRVRIYWQCFSDAKASGRDYLLAGTFEEKIMSTHNLVCKKILFQGVLNHRNHSQKGWIYYEHTSLIHLRLAIAAVNEVFRRRKKSVPVEGKILHAK